MLAEARLQMKAKRQSDLDRRDNASAKMRDLLASLPPDDQDLIFDFLGSAGRAETLSFVFNDTEESCDDLDN